LCVDGTNISNEPTRALLDFLRDRLDPQATVVGQIYNVAMLPVSGRGLTGAPEPHESEFVVIAQRAIAAAAYRDATLERRLTEAVYVSRFRRPHSVSRTGSQCCGACPQAVHPRLVHAIEPDRPLELTQRIVEAESTERRRDVSRKPVADGCRAAPR